MVVRRVTVTEEEVPFPSEPVYHMEDADLPGPVAPPERVTPDHTATRPARGAGRVRRTLREQFRSGKRDGDVPSTRRRPAVRTPTKRRKGTVPNRKGQFVKPLTQFYTMVGMATTARDQVCGPAIIEQAEACARSVDELAYNNESVRNVIWALTQTGMLTKVVAAHSPILFAVGMHHSNRFRTAIDNTQIGEFIAGMLKQQAEAIREQLRIEEELGTEPDYNGEVSE